MGKIIQLVHGQSPNGEVLYALDDEGNIYRSSYDPSTYTQGSIDWTKVDAPEASKNT